MPDASYPQPRTPRDWRDTFAALPQEAPPARAWETLSTRLDARRTRRWRWSLCCRCDKRATGLGLW
jgi:hypothetical protein